MEKHFEIILYSLLILLAFWAIGRWYYGYALRKRILDIPSQRSSHRVPTVRGGGILFFLGVLTGYLAFVFPAFPWFFAGFLLLSFTGWLDDRKNLSAWVRFPIQLAAVLMILQDAGLFAADFHWGIKLLAVIVALGFVNAFNFMDGINGITGLYSLVLLAGLAVLNREVPLLDNRWTGIIALSVLAFGYFNFRRHALMFAGDTGTMALAAFFLFGLAKFMVELRSPVLLLFVLLYGTDSAMTIIRRLWYGENIFRAHRWHVYQKMVDRWHWKHLWVAAFYALFQLVINAALLVCQCWEKPVFEQWILLFGAMFIFVVSYLFVQRHES